MGGGVGVGGKGKEVEESSGKGRQRRERNTNRSKQYSSRTFLLNMEQTYFASRSQTGLNFLLIISK